MENFIVSARKYRPATFDTVVGQKALIVTLKNAVLTGKLTHAYLFCGPRGVGKTTCARILAKSINCEHLTPEGEACNECESCRAFNEQRSLNIHELDAASNNSVDDIRELIDQVRIPPQIGRYKVFIIDEVHMLSTNAFNAFLKTLEEPPKHAIFILATTERHKVLPTILSRCQIYDFTRIEMSDIVEHLAKVAAKEGVTAEEAALHTIAQKADGGMRDALSLFDQMVSYTQGNLTYQGVISSLNILDYDYYFRFTDLCLEHKISEVMLLFNEVLRRGFDGGNFITNLTAHLRDLLVSREEVTLPLLEVSNDVRERYREQAKKCSERFLIHAIKLCNDCDLNYRVSKNKRLLVELTLIQLAQLTGEADEIGSGRGPKRLKPLFQKAVAAASASQPNNSKQTPTATPQAGVAAAHVPNANKSTTISSTTTTTQTATPTASGTQATTPPTMRVLKRPTFSIRGKVVEQRSSTQNAGQATQNTIGMAKEVIEDLPVAEDGVRICWKQFAASLPQEHSALAGRLTNMRPSLVEGLTIQVTIDNRMVATDIQNMRPQLEGYLRKKLQNSKLTIKVVVDETQETRHIYSRVEQFQILEKRYSVLTKLKEALDLDLG
ncbi:MAG: DNA polymerase III subunit gamma/tau [Bacteroidaceae bacterium]|nr:DNA polymerase III subunit gamma/tau [Bacteroidaceae bacterium]